MPISIGELKANIRPLAVQYHEFTIMVKYRPSALTPQNTSEIQKKIDAGQANNVLIETLCNTVVDWDLVDDKGEMYPITPEAMEKLEGPLLLAISESIAEDARPKPKSAGKSFARS